MADVIAVHRELLEAWRKVMDLVGPGPLDEHFVDADAAVRDLRAAGAWVDLGSGAGFPGIMLATRYPEATVTLVERRQKRVAFLREVVARSGLGNATVFEGDADALPRGVWRGVVSRAYKPPIEYLREAATLLAPGGTAVLLTAGGEIAPPEGLVKFHVEQYRVSGKPRASIQYLRQ